MKSFHCFFQRCVDIEAVNLQQVYVWCIQPLERGVDSIEDGLAGEAFSKSELDDQ
jgi:hypothetical protein